METSLVPGYSKAQWSLLAKVGNIVQKLQYDLDENHLIDCRILMPYMLEVQSSDDLTNEAIASATLNIEIIDGLPVIEGIPIWERLEGEALDVYKIFKVYRDYVESYGETRSLYKVAGKTHVPISCIRSLANCWHWELRAKACDVRREIEKQMRLQREQEAMLNRHAKQANRLVEEAVQYLVTHPEQLDAKTATQLVQVGMKAERLSLGLPADKPSEKQENTTQINILNAQTDNTGSIGKTEEKTQEVTQDITQMQGILNVLEKSGAFEVPFQEVKNDDGSTGDSEDEPNGTAEACENASTKDD